MITPLGPGLWRIATAAHDRENAFLAEGDDGLTLVDVGWKSAARIVLDDLDDRGWQPTDLRRIVLTHAHPDHVRGLRELVARTGALVHVHRLETTWLTAGRVPASGRSGSPARVADRLPLLHWDPVEADVLLDGGETIGGLTAIHTPGHSPGHLVFHHLESNTALVGDAVFNRSRIATGPDAFAADPAQRDATLAAIPAEVDGVGFAHGAPLVGAEVDRFAAFVSGRRASGVDTLPR